MPIKGAVKYRVIQTKKGPVRLAFDKNGNVIEAKNMKTGALHSHEEFMADAHRKGAMHELRKRR